ncbi:spermidine synthase [Pyxidicoccus sp. MSG2]|uniref:spermidine synthase n=1 Tax=Pyxidicoccus sp. MSG2 TaxID=2996790 RepID=UPI0022711D3C|nr:fused MFS/spermidine synthase [Pyxidicoccus sp. MSG2]MCY1015018.1 fused MFS/spermidine synthase [Pyxidicoccus sp. MSG2]
MRLLSRQARALAWPRTVLHVGRPPESRVIVTQDGAGRRYLQFEWDGPYQSVVGQGFPLRLELPYTQAVVAGLAFVEAPRRILVVGVGGGAIPMFLRAVLPKAHIDAVESDAGMLDVARRYFGFREDSALQSHVADGRRFIETPGPLYDVIILDAYGPRGIPGPLATRQFLLATRARLAPGGAVVSNVVRTPNPFFHAMVRTWHASFAQLHAFDVEETANCILVALAHPEKLARGMVKARAERLTRSRGIPFSLRARVAHWLDEAPGAAGSEQAILEDPPSPVAP